MKYLVLGSFFLMGWVAWGQNRIYCSSQNQLFTEISGAYDFKTRAHERGHFSWMVEGPVKVSITPFNEIGSNQTKSWRGKISLTAIPEAGTITPANIKAIVTTFYRIPGKHNGTDTTDCGVLYQYHQNMLCAESAVHQCGGWHTLVEKTDTQTIAFEVVSLHVALSPETTCDKGILQPQVQAVTPATEGVLIWQFPWGKFEGNEPPAVPWKKEYEGAEIKVVLEVEGIRYQARSTITAGNCNCDCTAPELSEPCLEACEQH